MLLLPTTVRVGTADKDCDDVDIMVMMSPVLTVTL